MKVLIVDRAAPGPYTSETLREATSLTGGAEASLATVAVGLGRSHHVTVMQRAWHGEPEVVDGVRWCSSTKWTRSARAADVVIVQRRVWDAVLGRVFAQRGRVIVWYHDWMLPVAERAGFQATATGRLAATIRLLMHSLCNVELVAVTETHRRNLQSHLADSVLPNRMVRSVRCQVIPNPVKMPASASGGCIDPNRMIFFSAAWKGLDQVLDSFEAVRQVVPDMVLSIASPGYAGGATGLNRVGVEELGHLDHDTLFSHVERALCVFYPASRVPETFGLIFAESHAVGTPVLAHPFGAACEMLSPEELVDAEDVQGIVNRIVAWRAGERPSVQPHPEFATESVTGLWLDLVGGRTPG